MISWPDFYQQFLWLGIWGYSSFCRLPEAKNSWKKPGNFAWIPCLTLGCCFRPKKLNLMKWKLIQGAFYPKSLHISSYGIRIESWAGCQDWKKLGPLWTAFEDSFSYFQEQKKSLFFKNIVVSIPKSCIIFLLLNNF